MQSTHRNNINTHEKLFQLSNHSILSLVSSDDTTTQCCNDSIPFGRYEEAARSSISSPKQMTIGGRSHAVNRVSRPSSALSRQSPSAANAAVRDSSAARPASGSSTPVKSGAVTPQRLAGTSAGSTTPKREASSHTSAVVGALGRLSPQEVDRLQRVLQQGGVH